MLDFGRVVGEIFFLILILIGVAFVTLLERKILGYIQIRKGPNKVGYLGLIQPISDAIKLFRREMVHLEKRRGSVYLIRPAVGLILFFGVWCVFPLGWGGVDFFLGLFYLFCLRRFGVYVLFGCGWSSNSFYSLLGALRGVAQIISYEVSLIFVVMRVVVMRKSYDFEVISIWQSGSWFFLIFSPLAGIWFISCLAETRRSPFDFAEGESELVSGFNLEYGSVGFAFIFMAEYGVIILIACLVIVLFFGGLIMVGVLGWVIVRTWIWVRGSYPRFRYDKLMDLSWRSFLPVSLNYLGFSLGLIMIINCLSDDYLE